ANVAPWRDLVRALRQLEARGEVRGGYFVAGVGGEQFALPEAVAALRAQRKQPPPGEIAVLCGADPLNLVGILTPGERVAAVASTRVVFRDGLPIAALEAGILRRLAPDAAPDPQLEAWARGRTPFPEEPGRTLTAPAPSRIGQRVTGSSKPSPRAYRLAAGTGRRPGREFAR
ncbi:MAG TPA: hypothetical protein VFH51_10245, partial [Myxococcota bacterium]|nr:hypothetical protein [Myxococcota bacterium]